MTKAPEQIWIQTDHIAEHVALDQIDEKPDADEAHQFTSYTRTDYAQALVAAAYLDAGNLHQSLWRENSAYRTDQLIKRTPTDARAALDRIIAEAVKEALQVKPLVWERHPMGLMASTGFGSAYIIDTRCAPRIRWGKWPGGHGPERETVEEMQQAAQADYEAYTIAALKGGEA